ncbi:MAG: SHOCT domain-containing protein [Bacillota bacterium]|nr:SHOCT domain-containing protein [Bacillota bacterium]
MIFGWLVLLAIIGLVIYLVISNNKPQSSIGSKVESNNKAAEIIKERYAKGEISREEYKQMLEDMKE